MDGFKPVQIMLSPPGIFDARSSSDNQTAGAVTWRQNLQTNPDGKVQTAFGWVRAYGGIVPLACPYANFDWHFQGSGVTKATAEIPSLLFASTANDGTRTLFMWTKTRMLALDETTGQWTVQSTGNPYTLGQDGLPSKLSLRFKAAQLQNNIVFTNNFDPVQYETIGAGSYIEVVSLKTAGEDASGHAVPVSKAFVVIKYAGVMMLMNTEEGGIRMASRIRWSDLNDATFWNPAINNPATGAASIADFQDLDYGERILGAIELLGYLYVLTDSSIWRCSFTFDTTTTPPAAALICNKVYSEPKNKSRCLWYPNTLVSDGDSIYYAGHDAIYRYNAYMADPERTEWIYRASNLIYDEGVNGANIDQTNCMSPVMEYWPDQKEIHFSWPVADAKFVGIPSCDLTPTILSSGINFNSMVFSTEYETSDYRDYGMVCYVNFQSNIAAAGQCFKGAMFMGISGGDYTLKQFGVGYARQMYDLTSDTYASLGYTPMFRLVLPLGQFEQDKENKMVLLDAYTPNGDAGNLFALRTGGSYTQMNANEQLGNCGVVWKKWSSKPTKCKMSLTPEQYVAANIRPAVAAQWNFLDRARFLYCEVSITDANGKPPTDGAVVFTRLDIKAIDS